VDAIDPQSTRDILAQPTTCLQSGCWWVGRMLVLQIYLNRQDIFFSPSNPPYVTLSYLTISGKKFSNIVIPQDIPPSVMIQFLLLISWSLAFSVFNSGNGGLADRWYHFFVGWVEGASPIT
jgi:hypothetical protein